MQKESPPTNRPAISLGSKILVAIDTISIFCNLVVYYVGQHFDQATTIRVDKLLQINDDLNADLRQAIVTLQKKYLSIPSFFTFDPIPKIHEYLDLHYKTKEKITYPGQEQYKKAFSRRERRDLAQKNRSSRPGIMNWLYPSGSSTSTTNSPRRLKRLYSLVQTRPQTG